MATTTVARRGFAFTPTVTALAVAGALVVIGALALFSLFNRVHKQGVAYETGLNAQYQANQNELSTFISNFYEQVGLAEAKSEKMDAILAGAVRGRYDGTGVEFGGTDGALFSAMVEAYPDLTGLDIYDQVAATISAGREAYKNDQDKLLDMLRTYDTWRESGLLHRQVVKVVGFPSESLRAQVGDEAVTGQAALERMRIIVTTSQARDAYESGNLDPLTVP